MILSFARNVLYYSKLLAKHIRSYGIAKGILIVKEVFDVRACLGRRS